MSKPKPRQKRIEKKKPPSPRRDKPDPMPSIQPTKSKVIKVIVETIDKCKCI